MQESQELVRQAGHGLSDTTRAGARIQGELVRKSIHLLVAFVPTLASVNLSGTLTLLAVGTLFYAFSEASRLSGVTIPVVTDITLLASRERDRHGFVLGPITLAIGTMLSLLLYPLPAASLAIYALAFGDGFASLVGTLVRGPRIPFLRSKTVSGSLACFVAVFLITFRVTGNVTSAFIVAGSATILEAIPFGNFDNIVIPVGVGLVAVRLALL
ncbi:MAG TPA: phosphatidate cytidylyltransferase [Spirochaetia bacterium]